ncbi:helix-turn-helix domain-containing protein [Sphingobium algorifonticola]|uniref:Helix-turn-helix domain-containing protein n=2 Tax=Sphingobium algorifonticola TaxID=2008318 RepID=A0A437J8D8_9SPHN|nr:helix-turn-helix domain-containing protein [Sphingobium algorifonticola]
MTEPMNEMEQGSLDMDRPGDVLRRAREAQGLSLQDVATRTRIPVRQLQLIEDHDYAALPGVPYAIGFARAYARAIDADEIAVAAAVRRELVEADVINAPRYEMFEPADPARVPPRTLAWTTLILALILVGGYTVWRTQMYTPPTDAQVEQAADAPSAAPRSAAPTNRPAPAPTQGPVVLTATDEVWLRIYDGAGERLLEKQMAKGETFTVPANANNPMILTGRPNALAVTVGGRTVAPLGPPERTIADVPISAAALLARPAPGSAASAPASAGRPTAASTPPAVADNNVAQ